MKQRFWVIVKVVLAVLMIAAGIIHFLKPTVYLPIIPSFMPFKLAIVYISGVVEIALGIALLLRKYQKIGLLGLFVLMIIFLPIHILDAFAENPVIGNHTVAITRIIIQFLLIGLVWKLYRVFSQKVNHKTQ